MRSKKQQPMKKVILLVIVLQVLELNAQENYLKLINYWQDQPDSAVKFQALGQIYDDTGFDRKAIFYYQKAIRLKPEVKSLNRLAKVYSHYGKPEEAIKLRETINRLDSTDYRNTYYLANLYAKTGQRDRAIDLWQKLATLDTLNPNYPYKIGIYSHNMNRKLDAFLEAYHRDPQHKNTLLMLVKNYKQIKFQDSADYYLRKGLQLYPENHQFLRQKVIMAYRKKHYKTMLKTLQKLDSLNYSDALFVKKNTGLAYLLLHKYQAAEKALNQALNINRQEAIVYYYLGKLYKAMNRRSKARLFLLKSIRLKRPKIDQEYFELGMIAKSQKHYQKAYQYFKKAYQNNDKNGDALWQMALLNETVLKNPEKARNYYEKYSIDFKRKNPDKTAFAKAKIKALKLNAFLKH